MRGLFVAAWISAALASPAPADSPSPETHWAFVPPRHVDPPAPARAGWARNPIDLFLLRDLIASEIEPAPEADRTTLIRRLRFDLTGLPPRPEEVDAFLADTSPQAYEKLVDRLLASPEYGERWARPWLDLARFSESDGFKSDLTRPNAWRYRDWVVEALNADMPYDRFVRLQIAGDELAPADPSAFIATGFNRNWPFEDNNKIPGQNRQLMLEDMTDTTAGVFLGLTVGCARCHDHKFDPISQKDYYRFQAVFAASAPEDARPLSEPFEAAVHRFVEETHTEAVDRAKRSVEAVERPFLPGLLKDRLAKLPPEVRKAFETAPEERSAFQEELLARNAKLMAVDPKAMKAALPPGERKAWESRVEAMKRLVASAPSPLPQASGMTDTGPNAPPVFLLRKGNMNQPGEEVSPGVPSIFSSSTSALRTPHSALSERTTGRRAALADWLTRPENPLTARVMVNRLWQGHFGRGIVATPSDFGTQGARPSNPELLDWLASEFLARGWSLKAMHRLMVTSSAYRQSCRGSAKALEDDPDNLLFGRMARKRLEGEAVRDAMLLVAGRLNPERGGPGVFPDLPPGVQTRGGWTRSEKAGDRNRRSLYVFARRNLKYPLFDAFDAPDPNVTCPERNVSVNAPQALMLLNSDLVLDAARGLADRIRQDIGHDDPPARVERAFRLALGRPPDQKEKDRAVLFLVANRSDNPEALTDFCHALINLNEFVFVD